MKDTKINDSIIIAHPAALKVIWPEVSFLINSDRVIINQWFHTVILYGVNIIIFLQWWCRGFSFFQEDLLKSPKTLARKRTSLLTKGPAGFYIRYYTVQVVIMFYHYRGNKLSQVPWRSCSKRWPNHNTYRCHDVLHREQLSLCSHG